LFALLEWETTVVKRCYIERAAGIYNCSWNVHTYLKLRSFLEFREGRWEIRNTQNFPISP
jgi:hypothetical protein